MQIKAFGIFAHIRVYMGYIHGIANGHQVHCSMAGRRSENTCYTRLQSAFELNWSYLYMLQENSPPACDTACRSCGMHRRSSPPLLGMSWLDPALRWPLRSRDQIQYSFVLYFDQ